MQLYARVAELGTLSAVARERDVPVSQVSRTLSRIEKACSARLIHRSTHGLALTAEGETFLDYCRRILGTVDAVAMLNRWPFLVRGKPLGVVVQGHWRSDNTGITAELALQGLGIARIATVIADSLVAQGRLVPVLAEFVDEQPTQIHAVTMTNRHRLPKIKACIDFWAEWLGVARPAPAMP